MKSIYAIFCIYLVACTTESTKIDPQVEALNDILNDLRDPKCPMGNHIDSIIPIEYGYPSEEMFADSDSGKIVLGGCELAEDNHYCLKHEISFP